MAVQLRETIMSPVHGPRLLRTSSSYPNNRMLNVNQGNANIEDQNELRSPPAKRLGNIEDKDFQENFPFDNFSSNIVEPRRRATRLRSREFNNDFDQQYAGPKLSRCVEMN